MVGHEASGTLSPAPLKGDGNIRAETGGDNPHSPGRPDPTTPDVPWSGAAGAPPAALAPAHTDGGRT